MLVSCEYCGRIKLDSGIWVESDLHAEVVGYCPRCGQKRAEEQRERHFAQVRETDRRIARGFGSATDGSDPFRGFRD